MKRIIVLLSIIAAAGSLAACVGDDAPAVSANDTDTTAARADTSTTAASAGATVSVQTSDDLGDYLVGPNGHTLYLFEKDTGTTTACTGGCAAVWPALTAASPTAGSGIDSAKLSTAAGDQVVFNGHLLYFFATDKAPGDTNGIGIPAWYPLSPSGDKIDKD